MAGKGVQIRVQIRTCIRGIRGRYGFSSHWGHPSRGGLLESIVSSAPPLEAVELHLTGMVKEGKVQTGAHPTVVLMTAQTK